MAISIKISRPPATDTVQREREKKGRGRSGRTGSKINGSRGIDKIVESSKKSAHLERKSLAESRAIGIPRRRVSTVDARNRGGRREGRTAGGPDRLPTLNCLLCLFVRAMQWDWMEWGKRRKKERGREGGREGGIESPRAIVLGSTAVAICCKKLLRSLSLSLSLSLSPIGRYQGGKHARSLSRSVSSAASGS